MLKRTFAAMTFAFAMVALNGSMPTAAFAQEDLLVEEPVEDAGGDCLMWCISHKTHHRVAC